MSWKTDYDAGAKLKPKQNAIEKRIEWKSSYTSQLVGMTVYAYIYMWHLSFSLFRQWLPFLLRVKNSALTDRPAYTVIECGGLVFACVTQSFEQYRLTRCFATIAYSQRTILVCGNWHIVLYFNSALLMCILSIK